MEGSAQSMLETCLLIFVRVYVRIRGPCGELWSGGRGGLAERLCATLRGGACGVLGGAVLILH